MYKIKKIKNRKIQQKMATSNIDQIKLGDLAELVSKEDDYLLLYNEKWAGLQLPELKNTKYQGHVWYFDKTDVTDLMKKVDDEDAIVDTTADELFDFIVEVIAFTITVAYDIVDNTGHLPEKKVFIDSVASVSLRAFKKLLEDTLENVK